MTYGITADKLLLCEAQKCLTIAMFWPLLGTLTDEWDFSLRNLQCCLALGLIQMEATECTARL